MYKYIIPVLSTLYALPAFSATLNIEVNSKDTGFHHEPYYVVYLANAKGKFVETLRVFGYATRYQRELRTWHRSAKRSGEDIDALSGPSLRQGESDVWDYQIDDSYINKGYKLILETVSESEGNKRKEVVITLDESKPVQKVNGTVHTDYMQVKIK